MVKPLRCAPQSLRSTCLARAMTYSDSRWPGATTTLRCRDCSPPQRRSGRSLSGLLRASVILFILAPPTDVSRGLIDREWFIRALPVEDDGPGGKIYSSMTESQIVHSLGIPVEEESYSIEGARRRVMGDDEMQGLVSYQLSRRTGSSSLLRGPQEDLKAKLHWFQYSILS